MSLTLETIKKQNEAILRRLDKLAEPKAQWVKASVITDLTGWNNSQLRKARTDGSIAWEKRPDGSFWYNLNSLHPYLIKQKTA